MTTIGSSVDNTPLVFWFPILLGMLQDYPRQLPSHHNLILNPSGQFIMLQGTPTLVAWPIPGNPSLHMEFLNRLQTCSSHREGTRPICKMSNGVGWTCRGCG